MELLRITRQIHCKAVEQRATMIHRQYNRDWVTSYSRPPIDPYLTSPPLQNPGGATVPAGRFTGVRELHFVRCERPVWFARVRDWSSVYRDVNEAL